MNKWINYVEFTYRVFVRQSEDINLKIKEVVDFFEKIGSIIRREGDTYWPVAPEDIEKANKKGLLIVDTVETSCILVRSLIFTVIVQDDVEEILRKVDKQIGLSNFALIRIVKERTNNRQAI